MFVQTVKNGLTRKEAEELAVKRRKQNRIVGIYYDGQSWCVEETPKYE